MADPIIRRLDDLLAQARLPDGTSAANEDHFRDWMGAVDRAVSARVGLSAADLPDCPYRDWFDDGVTPQTAARRAVKRAQE